jgi:hypothetical protein
MLTESDADIAESELSKRRSSKLTRVHTPRSERLETYQTNLEYKLAHRRLISHKRIDDELDYLSESEIPEKLVTSDIEKQ